MRMLGQVRETVTLMLSSSTSVLAAAGLRHLWRSVRDSVVSVQARRFSAQIKHRGETCRCICSAAITKSQLNMSALERAL